MTTEILSLIEIASSDSQKETLHNRALRELEAQLVHAKDKDLATPPGSPAEGDVYIVAASPTGAWVGHTGDIAHFYGGSWKFHVKREGLVLWVDDEDALYAYDGSAWAAITGPTSVPRVSGVTYASSVTLDCATADVFKITLTGNITIAFSNGVDGQKIEVILTQDATGGRTVTWDAAVTFGSDITSATASAGANKIDRFGLEYSSAATKYHMIAVARGY